MQKLQHFLKRPYYFQWLILFFVLHGYNEFFGLIKGSSLAWLIVQLSAAAWVLFFICRKIYRDANKAALFVTVLFSCYLFFGALQDGLAMYRPLYFLSLFSTLIPAIALGCAAVFAGLFFYKRKLLRLTSFLNLLFVIFILFDAITIGWRAITTQQSKAPVAVNGITSLPDTVARPDVYLILLDEYMGSSALQDYYQYNNASFESYLKEKGFYICARPSSNYAFTIYSMSSFLNMRYLDAADRGRSAGYTYKKLAAMIDQNTTSAYFKHFNYSIHNYSPFVFAGLDATAPVPILPRDIELITDKVLYNRFIKRMILGEPQDKFNLSFIASRLNKNIAATHERQMQTVLSNAGKQSPAFTYLHLLMPHKPFVYDSTGKITNTYNEISDNKRSGKDKLYLQYLVYTNKRIAKFIDDLFIATKGKAVIMVMSDHGYRDAKGTGRSYSYKNFNAVYLPSRDYHLWYDSVSNVNQFPLLFNSLFGQHIPLQKDSTCY